MGDPDPTQANKRKHKEDLKKRLTRFYILFLRSDPNLCPSLSGEHENPACG